LSKIRSIL